MNDSEADGGGGDAGALSDYVDQVLNVVERIPAGRVMSYGDIAEFVGVGGPRQVGHVMSHYGGTVPWWRVVHADGSPAPGHERRAGAEWRAEGTPLRPHGRTVDMRRARWDGGTPPIPDPPHPSRHTAG